MGGLPLALTVEPMKVPCDLATLRDCDGYCSRQWNFATALNAASVFDPSGFTLALDHRFVRLGRDSRPAVYRLPGCVRCAARTPELHSQTSEQKWRPLRCPIAACAMPKAPLRGLY